MTINDRHLAPYEEKVLTELREVVASRTSPVAVPRSTGPMRRRRLMLATAAAVLAVAAGVGAPALLGTWQQSAYAVERDPDGSIRIYIREYRDAKGLETKLRAFGVSAVVDYVPNGKQCREPRASYIPDDQVPPGLMTTEPPRGDEEAYWKLHPELIPPGHTFVYTTTLIGKPGDKEWTAKGHMALATGPVAPCELVPGPVLPRNGG
jgi:hypothetical protein